ncbi:GNAT family N-acetyltransferase [Glycomyces rhizosphaerae]|uniref:GNAT family N-acetyltransferase n=1 Tax=Glycomyces rhizosphaerae TaxID=2054422 RepID=A0ABV7Q2C4_9ACTN
MEDTTPVITIRPATGADAAELARLRWEFKLEEEPVAPEVGAQQAFLSNCEAWLRTRLAGTWKAWVAETADQIIGHVFVSVVERMPSPTGIDAPIGYLTNFFVVQQHRGRGVGASLLEAVNDHARKVPLCTMIVWPSERSDPLYRRHGYAVSDELLEQHLIHD